ncbi:MAG: hypothetical protein Q9216_006902 [Gyalolechia sp. 2 TL-2023]
MIPTPQFHPNELNLPAQGGAIGCETAKAFAIAGADRVVLVGRTDATLGHTKKCVEEISRSIACLSFNADVTDEKAMKTIAADVGTWDVFILNAGHLPKPGPTASADSSQYWAAYEV